MADEHAQFLVASRSGDASNDLAAFEAAMQSIPGAAVVSRSGGPAQPRLVVALPTSVAEQLKAQFGSRLIIEHNATLDPF
jgi:hypothetical protein